MVIQIQWRGGRACLSGDYTIEDAYTVYADKRKYPDLTVWEVNS